MNFRPTVFLLAALSISQVYAQGGPWRETQAPIPSFTQSQIIQRLSEYNSFELDTKALQASLAKAPFEKGGRLTGKPARINLPLADGTFADFVVWEYDCLSDSLREKNPTIKLYHGYNPAQKSQRVRMGFTHTGFHATVFTPGQADTWIDPFSYSDHSKYFVYAKDKLRQPDRFGICGVMSEGAEHDDPFGNDGHVGVEVVGDTLKTYRLALNGTLEYTAFHGSVANAESQMIVAVNRVNGVYENDVAVRMTMTYKKAWTGSDPFTNADGVAQLSQNQTDLDAAVGNANYDFGHIFSTAGGGVARLRSVGVAGIKAQGATGLPSPTGDPFYIDYVAHEMGHQFGGNHTFNSTSGSCGGGNRAASAAYEPGSGSTIMAYAGICAPQNVQPNSDAYFHLKSHQEIVAWRNNASSMGTSTSNGNSIPTVDAGANFTIPQSTPFVLTATGADANGGALTYCWEQFDLETTTTTQPVMRSRIPVTSPKRYFPPLANILANTTSTWDPAVAVNRLMNFRCTVRDNQAGGGGVNEDLMAVTFSGSAFVVTAPNTAVTWAAGSTQTVTWTVGGGSIAPNVNILLSTNGGSSFGTGTATVLLANTPNDGSEAITVPWTTSTTCRIFVVPTDNIFFDLSNVNFTINESNQVALSAAPTSIKAGGNMTGTVTLTNPAPAGGLTFNITSNSPVAVVPSTVTVAAGATVGTFPITTTATPTNVAALITATKPNVTKQVTVTVLANQAPIATNDSGYTPLSGVAFNVAAPGVLTNDSDPNSDPLSAVLESTPAHGSVSFNANGSFTYTSTAGYVGPDSFTYKASDGFLTSTIATVSLNVQGNPIPVSGTIDLTGLAVSPAGRSVAIEVRDASKTVIQYSTNVTLNASGGYSLTLPSTLPPNTYTFWFKGSHWLAKSSGAVLVPISGLTALNVSLLNGDVDGNNLVELADYLQLAASFDLSVGDAGFDAEADLDGNGTVDLSDYLILAGNFDTAGDN